MKNSLQPWASRPKFGFRQVPWLKRVALYTKRFIPRQAKAGFWMTFRHFCHDLTPSFNSKGISFMVWQNLFLAAITAHDVTINDSEDQPLS
jgi:hypothetical protein